LILFLGFLILYCSLVILSWLPLLAQSSSSSITPSSKALRLPLTNSLHLTTAGLILVDTTLNLPVVQESLVHPDP
jgi:hypothetical protein